MKRVSSVSSVVSLFFIVLLLLVSCEKSSSNRVKNDDNDVNVQFYKMVNIDTKGRRHLYIVQLWDKHVLSEKSKEELIQMSKNSGISTKGWDKLSEIKNLYEIDCKKRREKFLSVLYYDKDGKVLYHDLLSDEPKWNSIPPDTTVEIVLKKFCKAGY